MSLSLLSGAFVVQHFLSNCSTASPPIFFQATKMHSTSFQAYALLIFPEGVSGSFSVGSEAWCDLQASVHGLLTEMLNG
jgi:hypothetical protein